MGCPRLSRERPKSYAIRFGIAMFLYLQVLMLALSCLVMLSSLGFAQVKAVQHKPGAVRRTKEEPKWVEQTLKMLSLEEKVGQMLQVRYYADYKDFESKEYQHVRNELQKYHIGSVIFGMHFNRSGPLRSSPLDAARVANQLQRESKLPLLLAADLERGGCLASQ